ncbi:MAG TPA: acyl-CoA thioesterase/bile acid-CoA:amino acid N-acyltransferase family protein [Vicinamibacterales bacterium]|jgi:dienelactone hydrolase|nr:acyl-CoA thioesterase/bile acid-CoA:amino acid N-acyltransferase family protein [Vicinamibacterales bacterium]
MMRLRIARIGVLSAALAAPAQVPATAHFDIPRRDVLMDEPIPIILSGLAPKATVTIRVRGGEGDEWTSNAVFAADDTGQIDVTRAASMRGSYKGVDAMGLFWAIERRRGSASATPAENDDADEEVAGTPESWTLTAEAGGQTLAQTTVRRRAVAEGVRVTPVRADGLVGTFYEPPDAGRHAAMLVLGGSEGGIPRPAGPAGGLASRGYAVLALAYFGVEGLPRGLSNIPLEYFGTAINWLAARPSVDANRIGVLGASRGAELALLLGTVDPRLRGVVAYMPSHVVVRGCCDPRAWLFAWTLRGRPLATMPPPGRPDPVEAQRAEIQVERIHGPILLLSGKDDGVWPSAESATKIVARLQQHQFPFACESLVYDHTGHGISRPYSPTTNLNGRRNPRSGRVVKRGGTPSGTAKAREDSWGKMLAFVDRALAAGPGQRD